LTGKGKVVYGRSEGFGEMVFADLEFFGLI
jgi:hypothetical protein